MFPASPQTLLIPERCSPTHRSLLPDPTHMPIPSVEELWIPFSLGVQDSSSFILGGQSEPWDYPDILSGPGVGGRGLPNILTSSSQSASLISTRIPGRLQGRWC